MALLARIGAFAGRWFAVLTLLGAVIGLLLPDQSAQLAPHVSLLLGIIMFGMGLTLRPIDFAVVVKHPKAVLLGVAAQFVVMPLLGFGIAHAFAMDPLLVVGMILVGAAPGGTASNVIVYLARGDVALSVAMTSISTLLAPLLTPLLVLALAGSTLPVDAGELFLSIVQMVLVPVVAGLLLRSFATKLVEKILPILPLVSVLGILLVVAGVVGANADAVLSAGLLVALAVILHNAGGLGLGYLLAWVTGTPESTRRAVSIEVGMQNSGLAAGLATAHFAPLAALPAALFSVWHNFSGALIATYWARRAPRSSESLEVTSEES
ncbi:bile acid:sodium symporter family protein [Spiractinospora alimapuensis]|uniref:bile acid:sodium symporter family protein n=1 Tax=Spiractinospora alimapuensis TaxID=2820884 RepID=UPI001F24FCB8|nr:bile acid:sodium symporter family protein [Spiractinospora alimapuensis]QVQ50475.1 bile acid:sodium symporter family protein [Spiractinospora alimapuensis]